MFTSNPFADLSVFLSPIVMQVYIVLMVLAVALGTLSCLLSTIVMIFVYPTIPRII